MTESAEPYNIKRKRGRPKAEHKKTKVTVALAPRVLALLDRVAAQQNQTRAGVIRTAIGQHVMDIAAVRKISEALARDAPPSTGCDNHWNEKLR